MTLEQRERVCRLCEDQPEFCPGGYSSVAMVDDNTVGVLYELGGCSMAFASLDARAIGS